LSFFGELKRRHVFRVTITYIIVAWLMLQVADVILDKIGVPDWTFKVILVFLVIGFPIAVMLAWAYDLTPQGLQRTEDLDEEPAAAGKKVRCRKAKIRRARQSVGGGATVR
jgi:adenylate cyclase